jgi:hypothetical protein
MGPKTAPQTPERVRWFLGYEARPVEPLQGVIDAPFNDVPVRDRITWSPDDGKLRGLSLASRSGASGVAGSAVGTVKVGVAYAW